MKITFWAALCLALSLSTGPACAQPASGVSPENDQQKARFDVVIKAVTNAGYAHPVIVGLGKETRGAVFTLTAAHEGNNVLLAVIEPAGGAAVVPVEIESDLMQGDDVKAVRLESFIGADDLIDMVAIHKPMQLEVSLEFEIHHIVRRKDKTLEVTCTFMGNSTTSHAKGERSITTTRKVTIEKTADGKPSAFDVKAVEQTTETENGVSSPAASTQPGESVVRYILDDAGMFVREKK